MRRLRRLLASAAFLGAAGASSPAAAQDLHGLGSKTQLVLTIDRLFPFFSYTRVSTTNVDNNRTQNIAESGASFGFLFGAEPSVGSVHTIPRLALDAVIVKGFTMGGSFAIALGLSHKETEENIVNQTNVRTEVTRNQPRTSIIGFAPRFGYIIPFTRAFGFWPRIGFAVYSRSSKSDIVNPANAVIGARTLTDTYLSLDIDPQFVLTPAEHFFFHFGPIFNLPLTGSRSDTTTTGPNSSSTSSDLAVFHFGISIGLGVWF
jgi:hypothetical protein